MHHKRKTHRRRRGGSGMTAGQLARVKKDMRRLEDKIDKSGDPSAEIVIDAYGDVPKEERYWHPGTPEHDKEYSSEMKKYLTSRGYILRQETENVYDGANIFTLMSKKPMSSRGPKTRRTR